MTVLQARDLLGVMTMALPRSRQIPGSKGSIASYLPGSVPQGAVPIKTRVSPGETKCPK